MKAHYQKMFAYNFWANSLFIGCLAQAIVSNSKNFLLMSHLLTAEEVWHCRLLGKNAPLQKLWKEYSVEELQQKAEERQRAWETYLKDCEVPKLTTIIRYKNTLGQAFTMEVQDVLNHVVNHSTYHRAQIAALLRQESIEPPVTDYVVYIRQQPSPKGRFEP